MRIFWFGMHKILVQTELPRLRELGYEVFNPPYLSDLKDQSAELNWDKQQPSSLPPEVFQQLSEYNFFYNKISPTLAQILNEYFGVIIVTIHSDWLLEILKVFRRKIIYRTYGQTSPVSDLLFNNGALKLISKHRDFYFSPHSVESIDCEHSWLKERVVVIPYCLTNDIFERQDNYSFDEIKNNSIALSCPNIQDQYFRRHYLLLKNHFPEKSYRLYGVQLQTSEDPQVVGTLPRAELIDCFLNSNGYLYSYDHPWTCYLPPVEMMILGGPVIFLRGSLLDKYFQNKSAPGRADSLLHAKELCRRLLNGDLDFAKQIVASQKPIVDRYNPDFVWPIFDLKMTQMLSGPKNYAKPILSGWPLAKPNDNTSHNTLPTKPVVFLFHHFPGECVHFNGNQYSAHDGIPRVMRLVVSALLESGKYSVRVTARREQIQSFYGFFKTSPLDDLQIVCLEDLTHSQLPILGFLQKCLRYSRRFIQNTSSQLASPPTGPQSSRRPPITQINRSEILHPSFSILEKSLHWLTSKEDYLVLSGLITFGTGLRALLQVTRQTLKRRSLNGFLARYHEALQRGLNGFENRLGPQFLIKMVNKHYPDSIGLIPHYHLFPECVNLDRKTIVYLPDFTPHFFEDSGEFGDHSQESAIGQTLTRKSHAVLTNSQYSKSYLPATRLQVAKDKIHMFYLPNLNLENQTAPPDDEIARIQGTIKNSNYLFYPTQPRQNKNLDLLFRVFDSICAERPDLKLVLTAELVPNSSFKLELNRMKFKDNVLIFPQVSDGALSWLYQNASVLALTSKMEGNFPPQVFEALHHRVPVVATRLPLIVERLEANTKDLILCEPGSFSEFRQGILTALDSRATVVSRQESIRTMILSQGSITIFNRAVLDLFDSVVRAI